MKIKISKKITTEVDFPIPSYWMYNGIYYQVDNNGLFVVGDNLICMQSSSTKYHVDSNNDELIQILDKGKQITKSEFTSNIKKTISNLKKNYNA